MGATVSIGVSTLRGDFGALAGERLHAVALSLPDTLSAGDLRIVERDFELLLDIARAHPKGLDEILKAAAAKDYGLAKSRAKAIGFTEADFRQRGGGCWLALAVSAAILLFASKAE